MDEQHWLIVRFDGQNQCLGGCVRQGDEAKMKEAADNMYANLIDAERVQLWPLSAETLIDTTCTPTYEAKAPWLE